MLIHQYIAFLQEIADENSDLEVLFLTSRGVLEPVREGHLRVVFSDCWDDETYVERVESYGAISREEIRDGVAIYLDSL